MILTDSFTSSMYKQSFAKIFDTDAQGNLAMGFNASLEVLDYEGAEGHWTDRTRCVTQQEVRECWRD